MTRWAVKVAHYVGDDVHVGTWRTTVAAQSEEAAEDAALETYAVLPHVAMTDDSSFCVRAERVDGA